MADWLDELDLEAGDGSTGDAHAADAPVSTVGAHARSSLLGAASAGGGPAKRRRGPGVRPRRGEAGGGDAAAVAKDAAADDGGECRHDAGFYGGMCILCGARKEDCGDAAKERASVTLSAFGRRQMDGADGGALELSAEAAKTTLNAEETRLRKERKLSLILDLDHTLLNSARGEDVAAEMARHEAMQEQQRAAAAAATPDTPPSDQLAKTPGPHKTPLPPLPQLTPAVTTAPASPSTPNGNEPNTPSPPAAMPIEDASIVDQLNAWAGAERTPAQMDEPSLFHMPHLGGMWTKLRPGARELLAAVAGRFEVSVSTLGDRHYAMAMLDLLDPKQAHVRRSVASTNLCARGEHAGGDGGLSKAIGAHLACEDLTMVVDDTEHVWPTQMQSGVSPAALIAIGRYHFFPSSARSFGLDPKRTCVLVRGYPKDEGNFSRSDDGDDPMAEPMARKDASLAAEHAAQRAAIAKRRASSGVPEEEREPLRALARALLTAHALVFPPEDSDAKKAANARDAIKRVRRHTLRGCVLLYSRVVPSAAQNGGEKHPLERLCESLGARLVSEAGPDVTHVVTRHGSLGTSKVRWALGENSKVLAATRKRRREDDTSSGADDEGNECSRLVHVVHVSWLFASRDLWRRADELAHPVRADEDSVEEREWNRMARSRPGDAAARERQRARASAGGAGAV